MRRPLLLAACVIAIVCLAQSALAQSGRKSKAPAAAPPPPTVAAEPEPTPSPSNTKPVAQTSVVVGKDRFGSSSFLVDSYGAEAVRACIERLNESKALNATGGGDMTRKDAIDRAKKGDSTYVLWVEIRDEQGAQNDISLNYSLYMPQTAKVLASGRVYLGTTNTGTGTVGVGVPSVSRRLPIQYQLRDAGREVADRVAAKLRFSTTN
ncbi:MAG TPA: hypothetical protein VEV81_14165 [Pyrinomonadaceae bacterium]|nr:hypothetical protein [Pyrinomonadaceae bacterium]